VRVRLSVVIPTWQEAALIERSVEGALRIGDEVIVADGGSRDGTPERASAAGARVLQAPRGRGAQLHAGARAAAGDALLFLHADAWLPPRARGEIERALSDPAVAGGNFRLRFVPDSFWARVFGAADDLRRRVARVYYGDSAIFVRRGVYRELGGFRTNLPIFEDYDLARRLERHGPTAYVRDVEVRVSARRFESAPLETLVRWAALQVGHEIGVPAEQLARLYGDRRCAGEGR
jgi:rSAM/selenodomain-associated transferase 2